MNKIIKVGGHHRFFKMEPAILLQKGRHKLYSCKGCFFSHTSGCTIPSRIHKPDCLPHNNASGKGFIYKLLAGEVKV